MDASRGNRKAALLVFGLFLLGVAVGSLGTYAVTTHVLAARPQIGLAHNMGHTVEMFTRELSLTPDQQNQIQAIFNDTRAKYGQLHEKLDPEYEQVRQQGRQQIRRMLTPEQLPKFEDLLRRLDEERRRHGSEGHD
jgi:Spy/CpxP family protein refolding chaperone